MHINWFEFLSEILHNVKCKPSLCTECNVNPVSILSPFQCHLSFCLCISHSLFLLSLLPPHPSLSFSPSSLSLPSIAPLSLYPSLTPSFPSSYIPPFLPLSGCLDMVAAEGQFTFTADRPHLSCAAFFIAEPDQVISVEYNSVDIDCRGGDFIKVTARAHVACTHTWKVHTHSKHTHTPPLSHPHTSQILFPPTFTLTDVSTTRSRGRFTFPDSWWDEIPGRLFCCYSCPGLSSALPPRLGVIPHLTPWPGNTRSQ